MSQPRLGLLIKAAEQALMAEKTRALRDFNLTVAQYAVLLVLRDVPEASAAQLARACLVTPQTMATVLDNLTGKGLIARETSPLHQRVRATRLTAAGIELVAGADQAALAVEARLAAAYSADELATFRDHLERAIRALQDR